MLENSQRKMGIQFLVESVPLTAVLSYHSRYIELPGLRIPDDKKTCLSHCSDRQFGTLPVFLKYTVFQIIMLVISFVHDVSPSVGMRDSIFFSIDFLSLSLFEDVSFRSSLLNN